MTKLCRRRAGDGEECGLPLNHTEPHHPRARVGTYATSPLATPDPAPTEPTHTLHWPIAHCDCHHPAPTEPLCYWDGLPESEHPVRDGDHGSHRHAVSTEPPIRRTTLPSSDALDARMLTAAYDPDYLTPDPAPTEPLDVSRLSRALRAVDASLDMNDDDAVGHYDRYAQYIARAYAAQPDEGGS